MRNTLTFLFAFLVCCAGAAVAQQAKPTPEAPKANARPTPATDVKPEPFDKADVKMMAGQCVTLDTEAGAIVMELYPEHAPESVRNFLNLAATGLLDAGSSSTR